MFSSSAYMISVFKFRSLFYVEFTMVYNLRSRSNFTFLFPILLPTYKPLTLDSKIQRKFWLTLLFLHTWKPLFVVMLKRLESLHLQLQCASVFYKLDDLKSKGPLLNMLQFIKGFLISFDPSAVWWDIIFPVLHKQKLGLKLASPRSHHTITSVFIQCSSTLGLCYFLTTQGHGQAMTQWRSPVGHCESCLCYLLAMWPWTHLFTSGPHFPHLYVKKSGSRLVLVRLQ